MNKLIRVAFEVATDTLAEHVFGSSAILALSIDKGVLHRSEADVALHVLELCAERIAAIGRLAAIDASTADERGEFRDADAEELAREDVVGALAYVRHLVFEPQHQSLGYLAQEDARLGDGIEECGSGRAEQLLGQHVQHLVDDLWRGEHLIVGEVGQAGQYIGVIVVVQ